MFKEPYLLSKYLRRVFNTRRVAALECSVCMHLNIAVSVVTEGLYESSSIYITDIETSYRLDLIIRS